MSECVKCGHDDWTYFELDYKDEPYLVEACRNCTAVKPEGLVEPLTAAIREEIGLEVEVVLETLEEKVDRIDELVLEIWEKLTQSDKEATDED